MEIPLKILHLEDNPNDAELVRETLAAGGVTVEMANAATRVEFVSALEEGTYDLILADYTLPSFDGITALSLVREKFPHLPFIFVTGTMGEEKAVETVKKGATDYILKQNLSRLVPSIMRALREAEECRKREEAETEVKKRIKELEDFYEMAVGRELKMIELKEEIKDLKKELAKYTQDQPNM